MVKFAPYITALVNLRECTATFKISSAVYALVPSEHNLVTLTADTAALGTAYTKLEAEVARLNTQLPKVSL